MGMVVAIFAKSKETAMHLFFTCPVAKYIWSLVAYVLEANCRPGSFDQFWLWAKAFFTKIPTLPHGGAGSNLLDLVEVEKCCMF